MGSSVCTCHLDHTGRWRGYAFPREGRPCAALAGPPRTTGDVSGLSCGIPSGSAQLTAATTARQPPRVRAGWCAIRVQRRLGESGF